MSKIIYKDEHIKIDTEPSEIPWLKIFTIHPYKEMSDAPREVQAHIYNALNIIEQEMLNYYKPQKINIASFGNYMPHLHWHIMARFSNDSHYPEPMWGEKQRESDLTLPSFEIFLENISKSLLLGQNGNISHQQALSIV